MRILLANYSRLMTSVRERLEAAARSQRLESLRAYLEVFGEPKQRQNRATHVSALSLMEPPVRRESAYSSTKALLDKLQLPSFSSGAIGNMRSQHPQAESYYQFDTGPAMEASAAALSFRRATALYNFAMVALVIGGVVTILGTIGVIWASGLKSHYSDAHFAVAATEQEQAKADAARAHERAAELLLRAQQARLEQEKTSLELAHVRAASGGRHLTDEQHDSIVKAITGHPVALILLIPNNDPEAVQFANDLAKALRDGGAKVTASTSMMGLPVQGLAMSMTTTGGGGALYAALKLAGFQIKDLPERDPIMLVVGSKPPALADH